MNDKKKLIVILFVFAALMIGATLLYNGLSETVEDDRIPTDTSASSDDDATLAPDFTVYDADGNPVKLSEYFGKPIVLNFWASWCGPCKMEMPEFNEAYLARGDEIHFLMVNMTTSQRESLEAARKLIADEGYSFPVLYDTKSDAANTYGVYSLPTTLFINAEGQIVTYAMGAIDGELLLTGIGMIS